MPAVPASPARTSLQRGLPRFGRATADAAPPARSWPKVRTALAWLAAGGFCLFALQFYYVCFGPNFHTTLPGRIYRSSQLTEVELKKAIADYGLRTVINLRGFCPDQDWHLDELAVCEAAGVRMIDINLSTSMPPHRGELKKLLAALEAAPEPLLIHCRQGADRTSLAAALALLLKSDATLADARIQLTIRYAHSPIGHVQILDEALDGYEAWLAAQGKAHAPDQLRHWINEVYLPGPYWAEIEPLGVPDVLLYGQWTLAPVRVTNRSREPWRFRRAGHVGIHLYFAVDPLDGGKRWALGSAGHFERTLAPGESLIFNVAIPPIRQLGPARLFIDLEDEQCCLFHMVGSPPLEKEVVVWPWPMKPPAR